MSVRLACILLWSVAIAGCDPVESEIGRDSESTTSSGQAGTSEVDFGTTTSSPDLGPAAPQRRCPTPPGHSGSPRTIAEAVAHIQALPAPVDVPCVLESFARPLRVLASSSVFSAQPGFGNRSPRLFVFFEGLILSFATSGHGAQLIEFAEFTGPTTTVKAELEFPLQPEALELPMAFDQVRDQDLGTVCRLCHRGETSTNDLYAGSFASDALAPRQDTLLELDEVRAHAQACDPHEDAHRCAVFDALFVPGDVEPGAFDPRIQTIFDYE